MTQLDELRAMREALTRFMALSHEEKLAIVAEGYSTNPPTNYANLTPAQWAAADLRWLGETGRLLAQELNPAPKTTIAQITNVEIVVGD